MEYSDFELSVVLQFLVCNLSSNELVIISLSVKWCKLTLSYCTNYKLYGLF